MAIEGQGLKQLQNLWAERVRWHEILQGMGQDAAKVREGLLRVIKDLESVEGFEKPPEPSRFPLDRNI